jgi:peptidoglycan/LPS O-acetylase OafA/YrhL
VRLGYQPALDGLRGVAIALVVSFHAFGWPANGTLGVDLFFVLSGFLITTLLLEERGSNGRFGLRGFYLRRARRLLPALLVLLMGFFVVGLATGGIESPRSPIALGLGSALTYTSNLVVTTDPSAVPAGILHLWSLAAEEQFYVLWPLALLVLLRFGGRRLVVKSLAIVLVAAMLYRLRLVLGGASIERLYYAPDTHADPLLIGCALACCLQARCLPGAIMSSAGIRTTLGASALGLVLAAALFVHHLPSSVAYGTQLVPTGVGVLTAVLIACAVAGRSLLTTVLSAGPLVRLGHISYSLYLWHLPILVAVAGVHRTAGVRAIAGMGLALAVATASRRFVELPFLRRRGREVSEPVPTPAPAPA